MLTGDSEIRYQTNGVFKIVGIDMGRQGESQQQQISMLSMSLEMVTF